jgi:hypothetical protein
MFWTMGLRGRRCSDGSLLLLLLLPPPVVATSAREGLLDDGKPFLTMEEPAKVPKLAGGESTPPGGGGLLVISGFSMSFNDFAPLVVDLFQSESLPCCVVGVGKRNIEAPYVGVIVDAMVKPLLSRCHFPLNFECVCDSWLFLEPNQPTVSIPQVAGPTRSSLVYTLCVVTFKNVSATNRIVP